MKSYDLNLLVALDALLATCSVTKAAEQLNLSTPAMSHTLARIRDVFDDAILVRAGRALVPTPRALALAAPVRQLLAEAQTLRAPVDAQNLAALERRFVVRAPEGVAVVFGAALSHALEQHMPLATLQFLPETHDDASGLREGRIDLDVGSFRNGDPETEALVLSQQSLVGAVRDAHPFLAGRAGKRTMSIERFAQARHVSVTLRPGETSSVDAALAGHGLSRRVVLRVPSTFSSVCAASRTDLVACVPERMARNMAASMGLEIFALPVEVAAQAMRMAWHPRFHADPAHVWLRENFQRVLNDPHWISPSMAALTDGARRKVH
ncbi:LysR family transcriptional regulator [Variovorax ginsengisoli]|uniref:DNA-binding transcriptional LysR family regulator n=1 Tax=Variovorax ginsengisoli TaxID=363844 RepID=A0ABT9S7A8_9BURK|nr:LysR family transcriptional regulator [Variovorax ginsengisoli]MDP9899227.1 DNA-binding transcriptional LysR family regulator [Variovorax ginsengisoli]